MEGDVFSGVLEPVFFLAAMGIGLGTIVERQHRRSGLGGVTYLAFLAPGLLAANALQTAMFESTYPVMGGDQVGQEVLRPARDAAAAAATSSAAT